MKNLKINKRKLVALLVSGTIVLTTLTGCSTKEADAIYDTDTTTVAQTDGISINENESEDITIGSDTYVIRTPELKEETYVYEDNIIGDIYLDYDRSAIKLDEANSIRALFTNKTSRQVSVETIKEVVELSDALNGYNPGPNGYNNTTYSNIVTFNPEWLYYQYSNVKNNPEQLNAFCEANLGNEANTDAWVTFGCATVSEGIKSKVLSTVLANINNNGKKIVGTPIIEKAPNGYYVIVNFDGYIAKVNVCGEALDVCTLLDYHSNTALDNAAGISENFENSFVYNGTGIGCGDQSVYFSCGNDYLKDDLRKGFVLYDSLGTKSIDVSMSYSYSDHGISDYTKAMLEALGYSEDVIARAVEIDANVSYQDTLKFN